MTLPHRWSTGALPFPVVCRNCGTPLEWRHNTNSNDDRYVHPKPTCAGIRFTVTGADVAETAFRAVAELRPPDPDSPVGHRLVQWVERVRVFGTGMEWTFTVDLR